MLLADAGPHGHECAVDAVLGATALAAPGPVAVLTPDPGDRTAPCGARVTAVRV